MQRNNSNNGVITLTMQRFHIS